MTTTADFMITPGPATFETDLVFKASDDVGPAMEIEVQLLGFRREVGLRFLLGNRPLWIARRGGKAVSYAFGIPPKLNEADDLPLAPEPMGSLRPEDIPALIDHVLSAGASDAEISISVPMLNATAVRHLLDRGARIDPFFIGVLSDDKGMKLDRYIHTSSSFIL